MRTEPDPRSNHEIDEPAHPRVTRAAIAEVVRAVYAQAGADHLLADHLKEATGGSRGPHVAHACQFWSSVLASDGTGNGSLGPPDPAIAGLSPCCFQRWIALFRMIARARWPSELAEPLVRRLEAVAHGIRSGTLVGSGIRTPDPAGAGAS